MIPLQMTSGRQKEHNIGLLKVQWLHNLSRVLLQVGSSENANLFIGCSEIENRGVLEDLIKESNFVNKEYGIIHFDSPDKRGIDVALLSKQYFRPTTYTNIPLIVYRKEAVKKVDSKAEAEEKPMTLYK
jgi:hypothetical protein